MATLPTVRDFMDTQVPTLSPKQDIYEAVAFLLERRVTGAPVVDAQGSVVGMFTEKDCLRLLALGHDADLPRGTVADFMSKDVTSVTPEMNVYFLAGLFLKASFRRVPVIEQGKLVGAITRFDILRVIHTLLKKSV
jgi:CBS domain-containing protein